MFKRVTLAPVVIIIGLGLLFIGLDILDIGEDYRLYLPIAILNTVFIATVVIFVAFLAARNFIGSGSPEGLCLGAAALAFGTGIVVYSWATGAALEVRLAIYDIAFIMAAVTHFLGAVLMAAGKGYWEWKTGRKVACVSFAYAGIFIIVALFTWLLDRNILPSLIVPRFLAHSTGAVFCLASAALYYMAFQRSYLDFHYWYVLGLVLLASGVMFMAQGALESRVAWLGRASQYAGGIYLLAAVVSARRRTGTPAAE